MPEEYISSQEYFDPDIKGLFEKYPPLKKVITPDGLIKPEAKTALGQLAVSIDRLLAKLFAGHKSPKEWLKITSSLENVEDINVLEENRERINVSQDMINHWVSKREKAKKNLPQGILSKKRLGSKPRHALPGDRGRGRYSNG